MTRHDPPDHRRTPSPDQPVPDRLRTALHAHADRIEPSSDGLTRIEEKLMSRSPMTDVQKWILGGVAAVVVLVVALVLVLTGDDGSGTDVATASTTTEEPATTTSTTEPATTTTTTFTEPVDPYAVAFPAPTDSRRFDAPTPAARSYATDVLGFTDLVLGDLGAGQGDTAEVVVSDRVDGPETTIELARMEDGTWYVTSSRTDDIEVSRPSARSSLATPFETTGLALAFEGTVDVLVLAQDDPRPLGTGFVTGNGTPPAGPFDGRIVYLPRSTAVPGVLVYRTLSAKDGHVEKATSFPVRLTTEQFETPVADCTDTADEPGADDVTGSDRVVKVYFHCGTDLEEPTAVRRTVPADDPAILEGTLTLLLEGPTQAERDAGFTSPFPVSGGEVLDVVIRDGVATVDLSGAVGDGLPNTSATTLAFRTELLRTATQFSSVAAVEVFFDGSCEDYAAWAQSDTCLITET